MPPRRTLARAKALCASEAPIPAEEIGDLMRSDDRRVQVRVYEMLAGHTQRVVGLPPEVKEAFCLGYLVRCVQEGTKSSVVDGRFNAAWDLRAWFSREWYEQRKMPGRSTALLERLRDTFAELSRSEVFEVREAILLGVLEHIFQVRGVPEYFSAWQRDPVLAPVHQEACELAAGFLELHSQARPGAEVQRVPASVVKRSGGGGRRRKS